MGKAVNSPHRKRNRKEKDAIPVISVDYMFMTSNKIWGRDSLDPEEEGSSPILLVVDRDSGTMLSCVVPAKGVNPYAVKTLGDMLRNRLGYTRIV